MSGEGVVGVVVVGVGLGTVPASPAIMSTAIEQQQERTGKETKTYDHGQIE